MKRICIFLLAASAAWGSLLNGTFGWVPPNDGVTFVGPNLGSATSVTVPSPEIINALPLTYAGAPNDFFSVLLLAGNVTVNDPLLAVAHLNGGFFADVLPNYAQSGTGNRFSYDVASLEWSSSAATNLSFVAEGTLIDHLGTFSPTKAAISGSFTTTGTGATNASFTLTTEAPEADGGILALIGFALIAIRRRIVR